MTIFSRVGVTTVMSNGYNMANWVAKADLLVGAVLIPGAKAPKLVSEEMVKSMTPGSVIVDVAIDQGGSVATIDRITTHSDPTFVKHGVIHYFGGQYAWRGCPHLDFRPYEFHHGICAANRQQRLEKRCCRQLGTGQGP